MGRKKRSDLSGEKIKEEIINKSEEIKPVIIESSQKKTETPTGEYKYYVDVYAKGKIIETAKFNSELLAEQFMKTKEIEQLKKEINIVRLHLCKDDKKIKEIRYVIKHGKK
jgi:hypothetical protein